MVLLTDMKGNKRKVDVNLQKKIKCYQKLPGIYVTVKEVLKNTREEKILLWNKQKTQ